MTADEVGEAEVELDDRHGFGAVTIRRQSFGVPWVRADSDLGIAYGQGWVTARDRTWQLVSDRWRARATWHWAEGEAARGWDRCATDLRLQQCARRAAATISSPSRAFFEAHAAGVRDGLGTITRDQVPELHHLDVPDEQWRRWDIVDAFGAWRVQHALFGSWPHQVWRHHVDVTLGTQWVRHFRGDSSTASSGSNAWAVPAEWTTNGRPLLAADPHRLIEAPGVYQQVRLTCAGTEANAVPYDVVGLTVPGVPGVQHFGDTGTVAWVVTNAMAENDRVYLGQDRLHVSTPADLSPGLGLDAVLPLLRARTVDDVSEALNTWVEPVNAVLAADAHRVIEGVVGRVLQERGTRDDGGRHAGLRAISVNTRDSSRWREIHHPVVHANQSRDQTAPWGEFFAPTRRADRIRDLLAARGMNLSEADCREIQLDDDDAGARALIDTVRSIDHPVARLLECFDGHMSADSSAAAMFATWRAAIVTRLADSDELQPLSAPSPWTRAAASRWPGVLAAWLDPVARIGDALADLLEHAPELVRAAALAALDDVDGDSAGTWGERHRLSPVHALGWPCITPTLPRGETPGPGTNRVEMAIGGDSGCVAATHSVPGRDDLCRRGPVARLLFEPGGHSSWAVPLGAHGDLSHPHGMDQFAGWRDGSLHPLRPEPILETPRAP